MLVLAVALIVAASGYVLGSKAPWASWGEVTGHMLLMVGLAAFAAGVILLPIRHMKTQAQIEKYEAVRSTLSAIRADGVEIERAAFQLEVVRQNKWRASKQYWNDTAFGLWVPDEVEGLEPIR